MGLSALFTGNLSDRFGHRKVIIPAMLAFSFLACASGLAWGVGSLMLIRAMMGIAEGAYTPSSITATLDASQPWRHGRNVGIQQAALPLLGLGLGALVVGLFVALSLRETAPVRLARNGAVTATS